jgi:hypothetical protein
MTEISSKEKDSLNIKFASRLVTPTALAKLLGENEGALLTELKEEKGIFQDAMTESTILAWDTIQRACERRGITAIESDSKELTQQTGPDQDKKMVLTPEEKQVLQYCRDFHKEYSTLIENALPSGMDSKSELADYHKSISETISNVLNKVQNKSKGKKDPTVEDFMIP